MYGTTVNNYRGLTTGGMTVDCERSPSAHPHAASECVLSRSGWWWQVRTVSGAATAATATRATSSPSPTTRWAPTSTSGCGTSPTRRASPAPPTPRWPPAPPPAPAGCRTPRRLSPAAVGRPGRGSSSPTPGRPTTPSAIRRSSRPCTPRWNLSSLSVNAHSRSSFWVLC